MSNIKNKKEILVGKVIHYFDKIKVAIVELKKPLKIGEEVRFTGGETDFEQKISSMEVDHEKVKRAKAKQAVGMKVKKKVHPGYRVYKI